MSVANGLFRLILVVGILFGLILAVAAFVELGVGWGLLVAGLTFPMSYGLAFAVRWIIEGFSGGTS